MRLLAITGEIHSPFPQPALQRLLLLFDEDRRIRLSISHDGSMTSDDLSLTEWDVGEYECIRVREFTSQIDERLAGAEVTEVRWICVDSQKVGIRFVTSDTGGVYIWLDQEFRWGDQSAFARHPWQDGTAPFIGDQVKV